MNTQTAAKAATTAVAAGARQRGLSSQGQVTSTDWTRAILRSDVIELAGFGGPLIEARGVPWITIGAGEACLANRNSIAGRIRMRTVVMLSVSCVAAAFALGLFLQMYLSGSAAEQRRSTALPKWTVVGVDAEGLSIAIDGAPRKSMRVNVGGALPSGERLLQTDPTRRIYRTPTSSVLVRDGSN
ncbi:MAG: hypothetical protein JSS14_25240 [Proteobacteria bacterium]|nr:hypothetical protein [Pseudomonadota bacterium]